MDRLNSHSGPDGVFSYEYDLNGNRDSATLNGAITNYNYNSSGTRLETLTGGTSESRDYDLNGNTTRIGSQYFYFDHNNRFWQHQSGGQTTTYTHNAFGARMSKQIGSATTRYVYGGASLLHEQTGATSRDYIYLDGQIVGFVKSNVLYYVHNDHLGRPEVITNSATSKVWEAQNNAFANTSTIDSIGGFNVGFPGQYFDTESGKYYNYFRTYDPSTGRYLESDPIGLGGGLNTYSYVGGNPLGFIDPYGLQGVLTRPLPGIGNGSVWDPSSDRNQQAARELEGACRAGTQEFGKRLITAAVVFRLVSVESVLGVMTAGDGANDSAENGSDDTSGQPAPGDPDDDENRGIEFGQDASQKRHFRRHLEENNVNVRDARNAISRDIDSRSIGQGGFRGRVNVNGRTIDYRGFRHPDGSITVGRASIPRGG